MSNIDKAENRADAPDGDRIPEMESLITELREDGLRYRALFQNAPMGIYRSSLEGRVLLANPAIIKMLRYDSLEDIASVDVSGTIECGEHSRAKFIDMFRDRDDVHGFETMWLRKDGTALHVRESAHAERDQNGKILFFEGTVEDISKRKQAEAELRARLDYENVIASISSLFAGSMLADEDAEGVIDKVLAELGVYADASRTMVIVAKAGTKSLVRDHVWLSRSDMPSQDESRVVRYDKEPWSLKRMLKQEIVYLSLADRSQREAKMEYDLIERMGEGSMVMAPWICSDRTVGAVVITAEASDKKWDKDLLGALKMAAELVGGLYERTFADVKLREEQRLVSSMMNVSLDSIYFKDKQSRFIRANKAMRLQHGVESEEEFIGKTDRDIFTCEHADQALEDEARIMRTGVPVISKEERETRPDGSETWASTTKVPTYDDDANITGIMGISRDITDRKRGDEERYRLKLQMMQAQKMESLGVMCGGIAHDFNNFLMGILGNAGLALMEMSPESPAWNSVKQIETVALRAAELTNQLLAYSGKSEPERRIVHMSKLVKEMAHLLRVSIPKTTEIKYSFEDELPGVDCDPVQIRQVVMNLMINAADAIDSKAGEITVQTGLMSCDANSIKLAAVGDGVEPGDYIYVKVADNGLGMDQETIDRIFDPFFTTKANGHGLGMAVVTGVVKAHDGIVLVDSKPGSGTEFTVLLPASGEAVQKDESSREEDVSQGKEKKMSVEILIVEDDEIVSTVARKILENCGFQVSEACDGDVAIKMLEDTPEDKYGLIMLDVTLPGASGKDVLARAKHLKKDVPVLLMSGYNEEDIRSDYGISGYDGFLKKPFDALTMATVVKQCCGIADSAGGAQ